MCVTKWLRNEKKIQSKKNVKYQNIYLYAWKGNHYWNNQIKSGFYFVSYQWIVCKIVFSRYVRCISLLLLGDAATFTKSLFKTKKDTKKTQSNDKMFAHDWPIENWLLTSAHVQTHFGQQRLNLHQFATCC